jgi:pimeloyl-ACP methyl ester carboxylesterase
VLTTQAARLHDGSTIPLRTIGSGPPVLLPIRSERHDAETAAQMRAWGADPDAGPALVEGLASRFRVIAADYESHRLENPAPESLSAEAVAGDLLAIADAAGADRFAYYGYSWLALAGLQLAIRTDRLSALAMGGYPPLHGPYREMLAVTRAAHGMAQQPSAPSPGPVEPGDWDSVPVEASPAQTRQFVTLYESLDDFDDAAVQSSLTIPRLAFAGQHDIVAYGPAWGDIVVRIGEPLAIHREMLEGLGWEVRVLPDLDHITAMHAAVVLPILADWLARALAGG